MGRLTDNDKQFGPITYGKVNWNNFSIEFSSYSERDEDETRAYLMVYMFKYVFRIWLGKLIKPVIYKVKANWDDATIARLGRNYYDHAFAKKYGFSYHDGFLRLHWGMDKEDDFYTYVTEDGFIGYDNPPKGVKVFPLEGKNKSFFLPWTQFRVVSYTTFDDNGRVFSHIYNNKGLGYLNYSKIKEDTPSVKFLLKDFDGELITATTKMEESIHKKGEGKFKWISWFTKQRVYKRLDIEFDKETGKEKGSWKGGTIGCSTSLTDSMTHEEGMRKFCEEEHRSKSGKYKMQFMERLAT